SRPRQGVSADAPPDRALGDQLCELDSAILVETWRRSSTERFQSVGSLETKLGGSDGHPIRPAPCQECRSGLISTSDPLPKPIHHLLLNPSHSACAQLYPLGELAGFLQPCDVLRRVEDELLQLPFR